MSVPMEEPSRTSKALGPRPATALRRAEIVQAAADVFAEKGFAHGTLHEIADRVGMTHAGVLHHFGSKEQLLVEALAYRDRLMLEHRPEGQDLFHYLVDIAVAAGRELASRSSALVNRTVIGQGETHFVSDAEEKVRALDAIVARFSDRHFDYPSENLKRTLVVRIDIGTIAGKQHGVAGF